MDLKIVSNNCQLLENQYSIGFLSLLMSNKIQYTSTYEPTGMSLESISHQ